MSLEATLRKHLAGWRPAFAIVGSAYLAMVLLVPRPAEPDSLPLPSVDRAEQWETEAREHERAAAALQALPKEVRQLGEALRRLGSAERVHLKPGAHRLQRKNIERATRRVRSQHGDEALLQLRALQTHLFLGAVRKWRASPSELARVEPELSQLGGRFYAHAIERGWLQDGRFRGTEVELATLYRVHWSNALALGDTYPFAPTLNEWRAHYAFLLKLEPDQPAHERDLLLTQLRYVGALSQKDSTYPAALARGILHFRLSDFPAAAAELSAHVRHHPNGPWALRAKNYLAACGAMLSD